MSHLISGKDNYVIHHTIYSTIDTVNGCGGVVMVVIAFE